MRAAKGRLERDQPVAGAQSLVQVLLISQGDGEDLKALPVCRVRLQHLVAEVDRLGKLGSFDELTRATEHRVVIAHSGSRLSQSQVPRI